MSVRTLFCGIEKGRKHEKKLLIKLLYCKSLRCLKGCGGSAVLPLQQTSSDNSPAKAEELCKSLGINSGFHLMYHQSSWSQELFLLPPDNCKAGSTVTSTCWFYFHVWLSAMIGSKQEDLYSNPSRLSSCLPTVYCIFH